MSPPNPGRNEVFYLAWGVPEEAINITLFISRPGRSLSRTEGHITARAEVCAQDEAHSSMSQVSTRTWLPEMSLTTGPIPVVSVSRRFTTLFSTFLALCRTYCLRPAAKLTRLAFTLGNPKKGAKPDPPAPTEAAKHGSSRGHRPCNTSSTNESVPFSAIRNRVSPWNHTRQQPGCSPT